MNLIVEQNLKAKYDEGKQAAAPGYFENTKIEIWNTLLARARRKNARTKKKQKREVCGDRGRAALSTKPKNVHASLSYLTCMAY